MKALFISCPISLEHHRKERSNKKRSIR